MTKSRPSFEHLIDKIKWTTIQKRTSTTMEPDKVAIGFHATHGKQHLGVNRVRVRFGEDIVHMVKWQKGDKICVLQDPDEPMSFMFVKSENGNGYTLGHENTNNKIKVYTISFGWNNKLSLEPKPCTEVQHTIYKNGIVCMYIDK